MREEMKSEYYAGKASSDSMPGDWYVYQDGRFVHSCRTREAAIKYAQWQIELWRQAGAPTHPEYKVAYNRQSSFVPELVAPERGFGVNHNAGN